MDAVRQRFVGKATEHRRVQDTQSLGCFGPIKLRWDIGHVERDAIARFQAETLQRDRTFGGFKQQLPAADGIAVDRRTPAIVLRHVPAVTFEDERGLVTMASENVAIDFVEAAVGSRAIEPAEMRRGIIIEGPRPGRESRRQIHNHGSSRGGIPARPAGAIKADPHGPLRPVHQPVQVAGGDVSMKGTRIGDDRVTRCFPVGTGQYRIGHGSRQQLGFGRIGRFAHCFDLKLFCFNHFCAEGRPTPQVVF